MVAQLRHIVAELAATRRPAAQKAAHLRAMVSEHGALPPLLKPAPPHSPHSSPNQHVHATSHPHPYPNLIIDSHTDTHPHAQVSCWCDSYDRSNSQSQGLASLLCRFYPSFSPSLIPSHPSSSDVPASPHSHSERLAGLCGDLIDLRVPCPLDPTIELCGIVPAACSVFKSALLPLKLAFRTEGARTRLRALCVGFT